MIDAIEAYNMMPSVVKEEEHKEKLLKEIENKIIEAAKQNKSSITIQTAPDMFNLVRKELKEHNYRWTNLSHFETVREFLNFKEFHGDPNMLYPPRYNPINHEYEFSYCIDWNFNI